MPVLNVQCPICRAGLTLDVQTPPVLDLVCEWSETVMSDQRTAVAYVSEGTVIISLLHQGKRVVVSVQLGKVVPHGQTTAVFALSQIAPGVLKIHPSIIEPQYGLHAFVTIVAPQLTQEELAQCCRRSS